MTYGIQCFDGEGVDLNSEQRVDVEAIVVAVGHGFVILTIHTDGRLRRAERKLSRYIRRFVCLHVHNGVKDYPTFVGILKAVTIVEPYKIQLALDNPVLRVALE